MTGDRTPGLRDQIAEALTEWTLNAAGASRTSPPVHPRTLENLRANSLARADAVMHVIEPHILAIAVDASERADTLTARLQQAEAETGEAVSELRAVKIDRDEWRNRADAWRSAARHHETEVTRLTQQRDQALDQIAKERRGRLAAEAAVRRGREIHRRDDSSPRGPLCGTCLTPWPCRTFTALAIKQPKETPADEPR